MDRIVQETKYGQIFSPQKSSSSRPVNKANRKLMRRTLSQIETTGLWTSVSFTSKQEVSLYQTSVFHFWQNAYFSLTFAVCRKRNVKSL